jgi:hypothetical protein
VAVGMGRSLLIQDVLSVSRAQRSMKGCAADPGS